MRKFLFTPALVLALIFGPMVQSTTALVRGQSIYIGVYNFAGQKAFLWMVYQVRLPDGRVIWDKARHVLDHRIRKVVGVKVKKGQMASCKGGIFTERTDSDGKMWRTRHEADLCKLYRVRLNSGRVGATKVYLDYDKQRDKDAYRDPWPR